MKSMLLFHLGFQDKFIAVKKELFENPGVTSVANFAGFITQVSDFLQELQLLNIVNQSYKSIFKYYRIPKQTSSMAVKA